MIQELFKSRDYENFSKTYLSLNKNEVYIDFNKEDASALKFALLMLDVQKEDFNVEIINYLLRHNHDVIDFFESIKGIACKTEKNSVRGLISEIIRNKNIHLLDYLNKNHIDSLTGITHAHFVVSAFFKENFKEGLDYYASHPDFRYWIINDIKSTLSFEKNLNWNLVEDILGLKDIELFKKLLISEFSEPQYDWEGLRKKMKNSIRNTTLMAYMPPCAPPSILKSETQGIEPYYTGIKSQYYSRAQPSHKKYNTDAYFNVGVSPVISSEIKNLWLTYQLNCDLEEKSPTSMVKI